MQPTCGGETAASHELADAQTACAVLQLELQDRQVWIARACKRVTASNSGHHGGGFTRFQILDPHQARIVDVIPRVVTDQIIQGEQAKLRQTGGKFWAHTLHLSQRQLGFVTTGVTAC